MSTGAVEAPIVAVSDWDGVLRHFGLDPGEFEIADDTVRMSRWQQSRRTDDGDRDMVWLHSYKARFRRVANRLPDVDVEAHRARVQAWKPIRRTPGAGLGAPSTLHVGWADWQLGKAGTDGTTQRVLDSFERTVARVKELRRIGRNVESIAVVNMGDPMESCYGQYESQLFTTELTKRGQLNLVLDLWSVGLRAVAPLAGDVLFVSVLSNHSEWTRQGTGGKNVTGDSDNADGFLAETMRRALDGRADFNHMRWLIPNDEMTVAETLSGVRCAYAHGHKMPGSPRELEWLKGQSIRLLREHGTEPRLWFTAHRHHLDVRDFGAYWRLQHPALDAGSKWFTDATGLWSTAGTLTVLVGEHDQAGGPLSGGGKGWSDLAVL
ncbi:MAG: hypothetical protein ACRCYR_03785 [Phycicoccus sp.]